VLFDKYETSWLVMRERIQFSEVIIDYFVYRFSKNLGNRYVCFHYRY